jgi:hypothetical protein
MSCYCTRCGEEITAPKFHNGKPYGYTCYEAVSGKKAKANDKSQYVKAEVVGELPEKYGPVKVVYNGRTYHLGSCYRDCDGVLHGSLAIFNSENEVYMLTHDKKGKPLWKTIV